MQTSIVDIKPHIQFSFAFTIVIIGYELQMAFDIVPDEKNIFSLLYRCKALLYGTSSLVALESQLI